MHLKVIWKGTLATEEVWSVSCAFMTGQVGGIPTFTEQQMNAAAKAVSDGGIPSGLMTKMGGAVKFTGVRLEQRTEMDTLVASGEAVRTSAIAGSGAATKPFQASVVASLRTDNVTRQGRGRMYWPLLSVLTNNDSLRISAADTKVIADSVWSLLNDTGVKLQVPLGVGTWDPAVFSRVGATIRQVRRVEVGDIIDVQRKRRDKTFENRAVAP